MTTGVAAYYDRLLRWNRVARRFGYGGGADTLTVHRALADPRAGGRPTFTRLHDIVVEQLGDRVAPRILDAGCGLGGTMIALAEALNASVVGVTLSAAQARTANEAAAARGFEARVHANVGSYDAPPPGPFDVVIAIESLAHSVGPAESVSALVRVLAPGGVLVIVDDMPERLDDDSADLRTFKAGWSCPVLWSRGAYVDAFARAGLVPVRDLDLTEQCRPRSAWRIGLLTALNVVCSAVSPPPLRQVLGAHRGGLALERLLRRRQVRYRLLIAQRPALRVS